MSSAERGPIPIAMVKMPTSVPTSAKALRRQRSDTRRSRPNPRQRCTGKQRECDHALGIPSFSMFVARKQQAGVDRGRDDECAGLDDHEASKRPGHRSSAHFDLVSPLEFCLRGWLHLKRAVLGTAGGLEDLKHHSGARHFRLRLRESRRHGAVLEQPLPGTEQQRKRPQPEFVDEMMPEQRLDELSAAMDLELVTGFTLEIGNASHDVVGDQRRVVPLHALQRSRDNVFGYAVDLHRNGISAPVFGETRLSCAAGWLCRAGGT
jgi:hypothetical protein